MRARTLLLASAVSVFLLGAGPCASPQLQKVVEDANDAARLADQKHREAKEAANKGNEFKAGADEVTKCDRLRTAEVAFQEERSLGQAAAIQIARKGGLMLGQSEKDAANDPTLYLNRVGFILAARSERPGLPWSFGIIADDGVNAYSTPGGYVLVTRGLLKHVKNEAQLAGVLAHEIAHITNRHALNYYRQVKAQACQAANMGSIAKTVGGEASSVLTKAFDTDVAFLDFDKADSALESMAKDFTEKLTTTRYPDAQETQADRDAVALLVAAGYQPQEYAKLLASLPEDFQPTTHPPKKARVKSVESAIAGFGDEKFDPLRASGAPFGEEQGFRAPPLGSEVAGL